jgi:uncharacterized protein (DUF433 family)
MTAEEIIDEFPSIEQDDIRACLAYAAERERTQLHLSASPPKGSLHP